MSRRDKIQQVADLLTVALTNPNIPKSKLCGAANLNICATHAYTLAKNRKLLTEYKDGRVRLVNVTEQGKTWLVHAHEVIRILYPNHEV